MMMMMMMGWEVQEGGAGMDWDGAGQVYYYYYCTVYTTSTNCMRHCY